jgi:hypothetical protein
MCGELASADKAALDAGDRASGGDLVIGRRIGSALRTLSNAKFRRPVTVVISVMSALLLVCAVSYFTFTLRGRSAEKTPAIPSIGATASEPNIKSASAPLHGSDESPAEDANSRSAKPGPISKTETETKDESPTELWNRVRHGSADAEVALAKLYLQGTALERSCEQAHQLLLAASRKRSKAADSLLAGAYAQQCQ